MNLLPLILSLSLIGNISLSPAQTVAFQQVPQLQNRILEACGFLKTLYNPTLSLVRETPGSNLYYLASDNLLAQKALESCDSQTATAIRTASSTCCNNARSMMHEALLGEEIPLPIKNASTFTIANSSRGELFNGVSASAAGGDYTVFWEVHNGTETLSSREYADVAGYMALEYLRQGNQTGASVMLENLNIMFDSQGMVDEPYQNGNASEKDIYQTYKLALYTHILAKQGIPVYPGLLERLLRMQDPEGGFHTGYDHNGAYARTLANTETTSIVIIVLNSLRPTQDACLRFPPLCARQLLGWLILYYLIAVIVGTATTSVFFYWDRRRRKSLLPRGTVSFS